MHYLRHEYQVLWGIKIYVKQQKTAKKLFSFMSSLQPYYHFKLDFQKSEPTGGKWLIHGNQYNQYNQLQNLKHPFWISY